MQQIMKFEWQFPKDNEWETLAVPSPEVTTPTRRAQRVGYGLLGIALLTIVAWLLIPWRGGKPPAEVTQMQRAGQPVLIQETKQGQNDTDNTAPALTMQIQVVEGEHRWAMVDVVVPPPSQPGLTSPATRQAASTLAAPLWLPHEIAAQTQQVSPPFAYREMRFYQQTEQGWQRMESPVALWGEPGVLETAHLRFVFRSLDQTTVERVAAESEVLYVDLRRILGLPFVPNERLTIAIVPRSVASHSVKNKNDIVLASPLLLRIPVDASRDKVLGQMIRETLIYALKEEVLQQTLVRWQWQPVLDGLLRWLRRTDTLPFPPPTDLTHTEQAPFSPGAPLKLPDLQFLLMPDWVDPLEQQTQLATAQTLIEYIVATYGAESLAALLPAFGQHEYWTTLVPAVFGVSAAQLEADWHTYLAKKR